MKLLLLRGSPAPRHPFAVLFAVPRLAVPNGCLTLATPGPHPIGRLKHIAT